MSPTGHGSAAKEPRSGLPGELFCDLGIRWQTTVRGHIIAALAALPDRKGD
jgi:hypothetical protein